MNNSHRILLAEDNPLTVELTLEVLKDYNLAKDVAVVQNGQQVLDYLYRQEQFSSRPEGNPAVILLDIKMPRIDGLEVLRQVKADPTLKMIPVVILSSSTMENDMVQSYQLGANAYVVKPVPFPEFVEVIQSLGNFWCLVNQTPD